MKYKEKHIGITREKSTAGSILKVRAQVRAHLANERTFLAWIRTCLALVAFGILLVRWVAVEPGTAAWQNKARALQLVGESLMGGAAVLVLLAAVRFFTTRRQIINGVYRPSAALDFLAVCFLIIVIAILIYFSRIL
ncbi:MAG: DUF202 domain-containing protein [Bacillota bacterium]